jgi:hypothetical protein
VDYFAVARGGLAAEGPVPLDDNDFAARCTETRGNRQTDYSRPYDGDVGLLDNHAGSNHRA